MVCGLRVSSAGRLALSLAVETRPSAPAQTSIVDRPDGRVLAWTSTPAPARRRLGGLTLTTDLGQLQSVEWEDPADAIERCYELGWTDGLPVVPPTVELVQRFLDRAGLSADAVVGSLPERRRTVTAGKAAASAVMAGCLPGYFPVVVAATRAMLDPAFNLIGPSSSLGGAGILAIVNGPAGRELDMNSRNNLFGPGNRANATIGRSIRLILMNACAAVPGLFDRSVLVHPGKYTFCIAEADTETHWRPLHAERGFAAGESAVTVFACEAPRQVRTRGGPEVIASTVADVASSLGTSMCTVGSTGDTSSLVRQGEIAVVVSGQADIWEGWTKGDFRAAVHPRLRRSIADLKRAEEVAGEVEAGDEEKFVSLVADPEDILVVFAGGEERTMCAVMPSWGPKVASTAVTKAVEGR